jgi:hypothetical protein
MTQTTHLSLPLIDAAQAQKHVTHNEALAKIDALAHLAVSARDVIAPPASPAEGDRVLVGTGATGVFAGKEKQVAAFLAGGWSFLQPQIGWRLYVAAESVLLLYDGADWVGLSAGLRELQNLARLGVGATADDANPLSVKADSALFAAKTVAEGGAGDLRFTLNKESAAKTVSQLYQSAWSGRAETGLTGDDDFHVKVSPDGAVWKEAITIDHSTGRVSFPSGVADGSLAGFRNRLRNAQFRVNQRAVSGTVTLAAGQYGHDGVKAGADGCAYTFVQTGVDVTITIVSGSLIMPVEAAMIEGGVYRLSHGGTAQARVWQGTGVAGSGAYAAAPFSTPSLDADTQTNVEFSTGTVLRPQLEPGAFETAFERRPPGLELSLCKRYYAAGKIYLFAPGSYIGGSVNLPSPMRAVPTVSFASYYTGSPNKFSTSANMGGDENILAGTVLCIDEQTLQIDVILSANALNWAALRYVATAEI